MQTSVSEEIASFVKRRTSYIVSSSLALFQPVQFPLAQHSDLAGGTLAGLFFARLFPYSRFSSEIFTRRLRRNVSGPFRLRSRARRINTRQPASTYVRGSHRHTTRGKLTRLFLHGYDSVPWCAHASTSDVYRYKRPRSFLRKQSARGKLSPLKEDASRI